MPLIVQHNISPNSTIGIWKITESLEALESMMTLTGSEREIYREFLHESRKKQWIAYRLVIKKILANHRLEICYDKFRKPYIRDSHVHISVSHAGDMAAVILSGNARVGIDIEEPLPRILKVTDKFLNEKELHYEGLRGDIQRLTCFWAAKEALYKLHGTKNLDFRKQIHIHDFSFSPPGSFTGKIETGRNGDEFHLYYERYGEKLLVYTSEERIT